MAALTAPACPPPGELDIYKANCLSLAEVADVSLPSPLQTATFNGITSELYPRVVLSPAFAASLAELKVSRGGGAAASGMGAEAGWGWGWGWGWGMGDGLVFFEPRHMRTLDADAGWCEAGLRPSGSLRGGGGQEGRRRGRRPRDGAAGGSVSVPVLVGRGRRGGSQCSHLRKARRRERCGK